MAKGFIGNITAEKYNAWLRMTPSERKELARKIAAEKKEKERIEKEANDQYWRDFREKAQYQPEPVNTSPATYGIDTGEQDFGDILSEGWSEAKDTVSGWGDTVSGWLEGDDEDEDEGYQGRKSDIEFINRMAEERRLEEPEPVTLESAIPPSPTEELKRPPNINPRIWDRTPPHMRRKLIENMARRDAKAENLTRGLPAITPRDQSPPEDLPTSREKEVERVKMMLTRGQLDPKSAEVKRILGDDLPTHLKRTSDYHSRHQRRSSREDEIEKVKMMLTRGELNPNSPEVRRILGEENLPEHLQSSPMVGPDKVLEQKEVSPELLEELDAVDKQLKEGEGLIDVSKENVQKDKDAITEVAIAKEEDKGATGDFVRYDDNDYPIYKQGSKWSKSFNDAFARALEKGEEVFSWTGHDGISRQYTAEKALKNTEEDAPPSDNPVTDSQMAEMSDPSDLMPQITDYQKVETKEEKEEVIKKAEKKATTVEEKKAIRATVKQEADEYWIDPLTGFALNLSQLKRKIKRKEIMEFASTLPADMRALYYKQQKLIDPEDFDALIKDKKEKDALERKFKNLQIRTQEYKLIAAERAAETDPQRAEHLKMYLNAGNNDNYSLQVYLGKKLGLDQGILDLAKEAHMEHELAKLNAKKKGVGGKKLFSDNFAVDYSTVVTNKQRWIDNASSIVQTKGKYANILDINGTTKLVDRTGKFRTYGLFEHEDMIGKSPKEQINILKKSPYWKGIKESITIDGKLDPSILTGDKSAYEMYLKDTLVWMGMADLYGDKNYRNMVQWIDKYSMPADQAMARVNKTLTGGATIVDGKRKVEKGL